MVNAEKIDDKTLKVSFTGGLEVQERLLSDIVKLNIGVVSYKAASSELEEVYLKTHNCDVVINMTQTNTLNQKI